MANLSTFQDKNLTLELLEEGIELSLPRPYLGMSGIGHSCDRFIWYQFRWAFPFTTTRRMKRLFSRGHREEEVIVEDLARIGVTCHSDQEEIIAAFGHSKGHIDGIAENVPEAPKTPHLLELKTMNDKNFKDLQKTKSVLNSKIGYYAQMQIYMRLMKLSRALFIAVNKNDDSYYVERIRIDKEVGDNLIERAERLVLAMSPPPRPFQSTWYECKWCDARSICHFSDEMESNCRTCTFVDLENNGGWQCTLNKLPLSTDMQRIGCEDYKSL